MAEPKKTKIIPEPKEETRPVLAPKEAPIVKGQDSSGPNVLCGSCDTVLVENAANFNIVNVVLKCPSCGSFGDL